VNEGFLNGQLRDQAEHAEAKQLAQLVLALRVVEVAGECPPLLSLDDVYLFQVDILLPRMEGAEEDPLGLVPVGLARPPGGYNGWRVADRGDGGRILVMEAGQRHPLEEVEEGLAHGGPLRPAVGVVEGADHLGRLG